MSTPLPLLPNVLIAQDVRVITNLLQIVDAAFSGRPRRVTSIELGRRPNLALQLLADRSAREDALRWLDRSEPV